MVGITPGQVSLNCEQTAEHESQSIISFIPQVVWVGILLHHHLFYFSVCGRERVLREGFSVFVLVSQIRLGLNSQRSAAVYLPSMPPLPSRLTDLNVNDTVGEAH